MCDGNMDCCRLSLAEQTRKLRADTAVQSESLHRLKSELASEKFQKSVALCSDSVVLCSQSIVLCSVSGVMLMQGTHEAATECPAIYTGLTNLLQSSCQPKDPLASEGNHTPKDRAAGGTSPLLSTEHPFPPSRLTGKELAIWTAQLLT